MLIKHREIIQGLIIGSCLLILCLILVYLFIYYKRKQRKLILNENNYENKRKILGELMRKSFELAQTVEKVADEKEKRLSLKDDL
ncbi:hypothetical protein I4U23_027659 [Adineta vaga]|nr:hypothetical protein I4U23_027659 [Adineta vaga]